MMAVQVKKDNIFKLRLDSVTEELMERARAYIELNKSKFVRESIREKAQAVIAEHERTKFTTQDWYDFFDMMDNPQEPSPRMKKAAQKYKEIIHSNAV